MKSKMLLMQTLIMFFCKSGDWSCFVSYKKCPFDKQINLTKSNFQKN